MYIFTYFRIIFYLFNGPDFVSEVYLNEMNNFWKTNVFLNVIKYI